jgi:hypothetical protein
MVDSPGHKIPGSQGAVPFDEDEDSRHAVVSRPQQVSTDPEAIHNMHRREALQLGG